MPPLPISALIPTLDRRDRLIRTLTGLFAQSTVPAEVIIVDASVSPVTVADLPVPPAGVQVLCLPATVRGAAAQRNQALAAASRPYILFSDDDIDFEPGCIESLWQTLQADPACGACGCVITNQHYHPPGRTMRRVLHWLGCPADGSLAGRCVGPALNFLPAYEEPPRSVRVDWLNLCCTLFRRADLPEPALLPFFHGYSLMEDAALTMEVGRTRRLLVPAGARVYHDARPADYKDRAFARERMEVINRWYVMRCIMRRDSLAWDLRLLAYQGFMTLISLQHASGWRRLPAALAGKAAGLLTVLLHGHRWRGYPRISPA